MKITKDRIIFLIIASVILSIISAVSTYASNYLFNSNEVSYNNNSSGIASDNVQGAIDKLYEEATNYSDMRKLIYPVGSIYISVTDDTVAKVEARYGGTWQKFGTGKTLVGVDTTDTSFDTIEETGGEKTHLLTSAESGVPSHSHFVQAIYNSTRYNLTGAWQNTTNNSSTSGAAWGGSAGTWSVQAVGNTPANASSAHNNLQPYITVYMYKRTA